MPLECDHIRNEFSALLDNELNPEDRELVEEHLSDCSECLRELHGYKVVSDAYRYHHPVKAPDDFEERFHAAIAPIGRPRSFAWRQWGLLAAAGFTFVAGVALWKSQSRLARYAAPEIATSMAADSAMAPEAAPAAEVPQTMRFQAPSGGAGPEALMEQSAADSIEATGLAAEEGGVSDGGRQAMELGVALKPSQEALPELEVAPDSGGAGGGGFGGGGRDAVAMSAPAPPADAPRPEAAPAEPAPMKAARKVDGDTIALKSEAVEAALPEPTVAPLAKESAAAGTAMRAEVASPAPLLWREQTFHLTDGTWRQSNYADETLTKIAIPSPEWNALLDQHPDLAALCDREEPVIVKLGEVWYSIAKAPAP